jgi:hypothetical protein
MAVWRPSAAISTVIPLTQWGAGEESPYRSDVPSGWRRCCVLQRVYKARHNGVDNPNIAAIKELHEAGVELRVCGHMGKKVDPSQLLPGVQADLWAMVTMVNLQSRGYVRVG